MNGLGPSFYFFFRGSSGLGSKLIEFQGQQLMLANMKMRFEAGQLLTRQAVLLLA